MRTTNYDPPLASSLGSWLSCFRHRLTDIRNNPASPEVLAKRIGVSGATVRRWEKGISRPRPEDIRNVARECALTPLQEEFLLRALGRGAAISESRPRAFEDQATKLLSIDTPAYLMDSLFLIRGWNSQLSQFLEREPWEGCHLAEFLNAARGKVSEPLLASNLRAAIRDFWFCTAELVDAPEYAELVQRLAVDDFFQNEWRGLAFLDQEDEDLIGAPTPVARLDLGSVMVCQFTIVFPPNYYLRQLVPLDTTAQDRWIRLLSKKTEVVLPEQHHWRLAEAP